MSSAASLKEEISTSGLTIYDQLTPRTQHLLASNEHLEELISSKLIGVSLAGLPLRTRSKVVKSLTCEALGYPVPPSFRKTNPRFIGQNFDTYIQKSNNLQIWNEEIESTRRYVLIRVNDADSITSIRVVTGAVLAAMDTTGTLTQKYQARFVMTASSTELISSSDTLNLSPLVGHETVNFYGKKPTDTPAVGFLLPIKSIYKKLGFAIGRTIPNVGSVQERNRGAGLHSLVCELLGYNEYSDDGQFPDIKHQLLEVKLQTSPTIDLGLVSPDSETFLSIPAIGGRRVSHRDVRYAVFFGILEGVGIRVTKICVSTGEDFFTRFPRFEGKILNKKLQIPLPRDFFD